MGEEDPRKYLRIAASVRAAIETGELAACDPVPIGRLAAEHRAARQTVARALVALAGEGLVKLFPGYGYVVQPAAAGRPVTTIAGHP